VYNYLASWRLDLKELATTWLDRVRLKRFGTMIDLPDFLWRVDRIGLVRKAYGASQERLPRFRRDGTPLPLEDFAATPREDDPAARAEAIHRLHAQGRYADALELAGAALATRVDPRYPDWIVDNFHG